jgi:Apea-like HEPN/ApeA N-terminal domain 1
MLGSSPRAALDRDLRESKDGQRDRPRADNQLAERDVAGHVDADRDDGGYPGQDGLKASISARVRSPAAVYFRMAPEATSDEAWIEEARFWLPGQGGKSYGRLDYAPDRGPGAHLIDSPLAERDRDASPEEIPALHGETLGGQPFTLLDLWVVGHQRWWGAGDGGNTVDVLGSMLVRGAHIDSDSDLHATNATVKLDGLYELLTGGAVDQPLFALSAGPDAHAHLEVSLKGATLRLAVGAREQIGRHRQSAELEASAHLKLDKRLSLADLDDQFLLPLRDLIIFAGNLPSWIQQLSIADLTDMDERSPETLAAGRLIVRPPEVPRPPRVSSSYYSLMLNPGSVGDAAATLRNWFLMRKRLGSVWPLFFTTLARQELPIENQLVNLAAFAEGYHRALHDHPPLTTDEDKEACQAMLGVIGAKRQRRIYRQALLYANSQTLGERTEWFAIRAVEVLSSWDIDVELLAREVSHTRNWLAHWGQRGKYVRDGDDLVVLLRRLELVLRTNLLLDLELTREEAAHQVASGMRLARLP